MESPFRSLLDKLRTDGGFRGILENLSQTVAQPIGQGSDYMTLLDDIVNGKDALKSERDRLLADVQSRLFGVKAASVGTPPACPVVVKGEENETIERPKTPKCEVSVSGYNVAYVKPSPAPSSPTYGASFVSDVTIPDDTEWPAGALFEKRWSILNSGDTAWPVGTTLVQVGGWKSDSPTEAKVPLALPGETVEIALHGVQAPTQEGDHMSFWRVVLPDGTRIGDRIWIGALTGA